MSVKLLITGMSNTGKTTLLKSLTDCLVFARDGKPFSLELPHVNMPDYTKIDEFLEIVWQKIETYNDKFKTYPRTVVFDSVSRIFTDIEVNSDARFKGFDVWKNVNKEITQFITATNAIVENNVNVVLITHIKWDDKAGRYVETSKGSFGQTGGFLSTVDYAINIDLVGNKRIVTHRNNLTARTLLESIPDQQVVDDFSLQEYIDKIEGRSNIIQEKWSI